MEIKSLPRESPATPRESDFELEAAQSRLKTGRNDPCPCGSRRKFKKCCLLNDETFVRQSVTARQARQVQRDETMLPSVGDADVDAAPAEVNREPWDEQDRADETEFTPDVESRIEEVWDDFETLTHPTTEQMEEFLTQLLALPPDATQWSDVVHRFARHKHRDLPGVFHRISAAVPHTKDAGMGFFYWAAAEEFVRHGMSHLLPEVAAGFRKLDIYSYDPDALTHVEDYLLASGFDAEMLQLAEHFLPIERADDGLMPYAVPQRCNLIFELRVGQALRGEPIAERSTEKIAEQLRRDLEDNIHVDAARNGAEIASGQAPPSVWTRSQFELVTGDICTDSTAWRDCLRLSGTLMRAAQESWLLAKQPPGCMFRGLCLLLNSVYDWNENRSKKGKRSSDNLLDYLRPAGLEQRISQSCRDIIGVNEPRVRLLLQAHELLTRFAARHQLISLADAAKMEMGLVRLRNKIEGP